MRDRSATALRWRNTRRTALVSCLALALAVGGQRASDAAPTPAEVGNGTAKATATTSRIAPGVGQLELGMTNGTAVTQVTNSLAQATSQVMDLGLIGTSLTSVDCEGNQNVKPEDLPQPTSVDNRNGDAKASADEYSDPSSPVGAGRKEVEAKHSVPESHATTTSAAIQLAPAFEIGGARAEALTRVLPGKGREALAAVETSIDVGGVFALSGMRWSARHRTGTEPLAEAAFEIGRAELGGLPFPSDDLGALEEALNQLLVPSGITVTFPKVERFTEPTDLIRATPMRIEIRDSPAGKAALGPALELTRTQREQLFDEIVSFYCQSASLLLVGDIGVSIAAGTGFLVVDLGGVEATSGDLVLTNPFGAPIVPPQAGVAPGGAAASPSTPGTPGVPGTSGGVPATVAPGTVDEVATVPAGSSGPLVELCESIHPNGSPGCSTGAAWAVGLVGVLATVGVAGTEVVWQRRRHGVLDELTSDEIGGAGE